MKTRCLVSLFVSFLSLTAAAAAQGHSILFSFHGGPTTGKDSTGGTSKTGVMVSGMGNTIVEPGAGATNEGVADAIDAALKAKGYKTSRPNKNEVKVEAGPGGKPITGGGGVGDTDTGLAGVNVKILKPAVPAPKVKPAGCAIPKFFKGLRARLGGIVQWLIDVVDQNGNRRQVPLQLPVQPNDSTDALNQRMQQMLQQAGFHLTTCFYPSVFDPQQRLECWQLDRTRAGMVIDHITVQGLVPIEILAMELVGGMTPIQGAVDYGQGVANGLPFAPWLRPGLQPPAIGSFFDVFAEVGLPSQPATLLLGASKWDLPLQFLGPDAHLLVGLQPALWLPGATDAFGVMRTTLPIPPDPRLESLQLYFQAIPVTPQQSIGLSDGLEIVIGK
jgi:hypothetical protein